MTWKSNNIIEKISGNSKHHLFNYYEVRNKLIGLFGEPETDLDHKILLSRARKCMNSMPVFIINHKGHMEYEDKLRKEIKTNPFKEIARLKAELSLTQHTFQKKINKYRQMMK